MQIKQPLKILSTTIIVIGALSTIGGAYYFYKNNLWKPKVIVDKIDWQKGIADLIINGKPRKLFSNSTLAAGGDWGVRFASSLGDLSNTRIELVKLNLVFDIITKSN